MVDLNTLNKLIEASKSLAGMVNDAGGLRAEIMAASAELQRQLNPNIKPLTRKTFQVSTILEVEGVIEDLGGGVSLPLLHIPAGSFQMGSPVDEPERSAAEEPQHEVTLASFFMSQTPITQAQWRAVAMAKPAKSGQLRPTTLDLEPSRFKGDQRPVEQVSWHGAMEFCRRLSQRTGRHYTLPSEAQWEYACRAGTTTPFYFGATINTELANYDGDFVYQDGVKGKDRRQTTEVASFPANAWGLHDMHGNVWEWCLDHWHDSYAGAPEDDRPWTEPEANTNQDQESRRLLRGGSWFNHPRRCRSAYRFGSLPDYRCSSVGFRVCCLP